MNAFPKFGAFIIAAALAALVAIAQTQFILSRNIDDYHLVSDFQRRMVQTKRPWTSTLKAHRSVHSLLGHGEELHLPTLLPEFKHGP